MALVLDDLLAPVGEDDPAGPDLAYDPQRHAIEQAFDTPVSIDASGLGSSGAEIDWRDIVQAISDQSLRTKDIWLAVYLVRAGARSGRIDTVAIGAQMLAGLLESFWPVVHPRLEEYGFEARKGACDTLTQFREFPAPFGRIVLIDHQRLGRFSIDDVVRFDRGGESEDGYGLFRAALDEGSMEHLMAARSAVAAIRDGFSRADAVLMTHAGALVGTNFAAIYDGLEAIDAAVASLLQDSEAATPVEVGEAPSASVTAGAPKRVPDAIQTREDVVRMLDRLIGWYASNEPASPVPLLLGRAKGWVTMDFLAVLQDIAPSAVDDARRVLSTRPTP